MGREGVGQGAQHQHSLGGLLMSFCLPPVLCLCCSSLLFPSHPISSLLFSSSLSSSVPQSLYWEQKWGKSGNTERSGRCFNLPKAMKRNQAAGVCKSRGSDLDPVFYKRKVRSGERRTSSSQCHVDLPSHFPILLLLLSMTRFPLGNHPCPLSVPVV